MLRATFAHYDASVVVRTASQMRSVVADAPSGFGGDPARYRYDVIFLKSPLTAAVALRDVPLKEGVDVAAAGNGVLYSPATHEPRYPEPALTRGGHADVPAHDDPQLEHDDEARGARGGTGRLNGLRGGLSDPGRR